MSKSISSPTQSPAAGNTPTPTCFLCGKPGPAEGIQIAGANRVLVQEVLTMVSDEELAGIKAATHPDCWDSAEWLGEQYLPHT
ncbi:hypothetical protein LG293_15840 (plasmid) [Citricoccus nitrophenolicus]